MSPEWIAVLSVGIPLLLALLLFLLVRFLRKKRRQRENRRKGEAGEEYIASILARCGIGGDVLLNNVVLCNEHTGASTEIDHILLSTRGIFVVETKNLSGDIRGSDAREEWEQWLGEVRHTFRSPVLQNEGHVLKVKSVTGCDAVESLVVFAQGNTAHIESKYVFKPDQLFAYFSDRRSVISAEERNRAEARLRECMARSISAEEHRRNMEKKYPEK